MLRRPQRTDSSSSSKSELEVQHGAQSLSENRAYDIGRGYIASHPPSSTSPGLPSVTGSGNSSIRRIYRGTHREYAIGYVESGNTQWIMTEEEGDFHTNTNEQTAYFTFSRRYAEEIAAERSPGMVIEQVVPAGLLNGNNSYYFDDQPSPEWRTVVRAYRAQERLGRDAGNLRRVQRSPILSGPTASVSTPTLLNKLRRYPPESKPYQDAFKPVVSSSSDSDPAIDTQRRERTYTQQIAIKGEALERLSKEPRYARLPPRRTRRNRRN